MHAWAERGYAVLSYTARGFNELVRARRHRAWPTPPAARQGWIHLADTRYEVRDTQYLAGQLADQGLVDGQRIGATGGSYGGGSRWRWPRSRTA